MFTVDWVLLGWSHRGYRPRGETISSLSAHDASRWPIMIVGQLALAAAFVAVAVLVVAALGRRGWPAAVVLGLATVGTLQLSAFRTICNRADVGWCTPQPRFAYGHDQWLHGTGTAAAFTGLLLACVATAWGAWPVSGLRDLVVASVVAEAVALPFVLWFLSNADDPVGRSWHGFAEKVFLGTLGAWTAYAGIRLAAVVRADAGPVRTAPRRAS